MAKRAARPVIGVTVSRKGGRFMWWFNRFAVWLAGGKAMRLTVGDEGRIDTLEGLIVGGGDDIAPTLYGGELDPAVRIDRERDRLEQILLKEADARNLPILGICRGAQMINVSLGGTLHQDIYAVYENLPKRRTPLPIRDVHLEADSNLARILAVRRCRVNVIHHQAVDRLGESLRVVGRDDHGMIQAIEHKTGSFLIGVQWHPEFLFFTRGQRRLFRSLVQAARKDAERAPRM